MTDFSYEDLGLDEETVADIAMSLKFEEEVNPWSKLNLDQADVKEFVLSDYGKQDGKNILKALAKYTSEHLEPLTVYEAAYNDLAARTDYVRSIAKIPGHKYDFENAIGADDTGITILAPTEKKLDLAKKVADFYHLSYKGPIFRKEHAARKVNAFSSTEHENDTYNYWLKIYIPEEIQNLDADEYLSRF